jgi:hypothetical protein
MDTNSIQLDPNVQYPATWRPFDYRCNCRRNVHVGTQVIFGPFSAQEYKHCDEDELHFLPGPIFAAWEEHDGQLVRI